MPFFCDIVNSAVDENVEGEFLARLEPVLLSSCVGDLVEDVLDRFYCT